MGKELFPEGRKVASVIENCPAHPQTENLKSIKLCSPTEHNFSDSADGPACDLLTKSTVS